MSPEKTKLDALRINRPEAVQTSRANPLPWVLLVLVTAAVGLWWFFSQRAPAPVEVDLASAVAVNSDGGRTVLNASGYVTARRNATVSSKTTGKVIEILIEEGMSVTEGQLIARLDDTNLRANLNLAQARVQATKSAQEETRVQLAEAKLTLGRTKRLVENLVATTADLDRDEAQVDTLAARLQRQLQDEQVAVREVEVWNRQMDDTQIRAPFTGVVISKDAQPGEMISPVSAGGGFTRTGIGTIVDMSSLEIEVDVNESYINRVQDGQEVVATLDAYPTWQIPCAVIAIVPTADRQKATVRVRIGFKESDARILPDMGVKVAFRTTESQPETVRGVAVPKSAVRVDNGRDVVFVFQAGLLERRAVTTGDLVRDTITVLAGLKAGERVVLAPTAEMIDGQQVKEKVQ